MADKADSDFLTAEMAHQQHRMMIDQQTAMMEQAMARNVLNAVSAVEAKMDHDIARLSKIEDMKESELDILRDQRKEQMQKLAARKQEWRRIGHGIYTQIQGQKEFFAEVKKSERVVVHFFRSATFSCNLIDRRFSDLSKKHIETRFLKIDAEKSPFLVERLNIWMMPSIVLIKNGVTEHTIVGLDEFGGTEDFSQEMVAYVLGTHGIINHDGRPPENSESDRLVINRHLKGEKAIKEKEQNLSDDEDWWD